MVSVTGEGVKQAAARLFRRLQTRYAELRAAWLAGWLERELLGELLAELRRGALVPQSIAIRDVEAALAELRCSSASPLEDRAPTRAEQNTPGYVSEG
jgi:hypothetical protein